MVMLLLSFPLLYFTVLFFTFANRVCVLSRFAVGRIYGIVLGVGEDEWIDVFLFGEWVGDGWRFDGGVMLMIIWGRRVLMIIGGGVSEW